MRFISPWGEWPPRRQAEKISPVAEQEQLEQILPCEQQMGELYKQKDAYYWWRVADRLAEELTFGCSEGNYPRGVVTDDKASWLKYAQKRIDKEENGNEF
jgi:hypothetical protein